MQIICPLCQSELVQQTTRWVCGNQHSFDVAKQGYVNLLPVQHKKSKSPGDTTEAVLARREFLQAGFYEPLRQLLMQEMAALQPGAVLDLGCGEGYYTRGMATVADQVVGLDIAKAAVQIAARRYPEMTWLVASGARLPIASTTLDVVSSFFSPLPVEEMARVLKPEGYVFMVTPAPQHLYEMRAALFEQVNLHEPDKFLDILSPSFSLIKAQVLTYPLQLEQAALRQLIAMTPYAWKAKAERRQQLEQVDKLMTQASFQLYVLQKSPVINSYR
ncbi:putative RNA methyltransferase [Alkanindiges sp. WGS2144]|uniref:putative RNA methyltransferase n=1 Tax=Alkanindiges sp. WGS2144 TaxID=3366808 RepID=UPI003752B816